MSSESIQLTPDSKKEFDVLCETHFLDKATRLRAIYLFEEFLERVRECGDAVSPQDYLTYLKIAVLVSSKDAQVKSVTGAQTRQPGIRITSLLKSCPQRCPNQPRKIRIFAASVPPAVVHRSGHQSPAADRRPDLPDLRGPLPALQGRGRQVAAVVALGRRG